MSDLLKDDSNSLPKFDVLGDENTVSQRWTKWVRALNYKIDAAGVTKNERKKAMLLHYAGFGIQEIWSTLPEAQLGVGMSAAGENVFSTCVNALTAYFQPVLNFAFERREFHAMRPRAEETTTQFCTRLQTKVITCDFEKQDREVADMLVSYCQNENIAKELLKLKHDEFNLLKVREVIRLNESISMQAKSILNDSNNNEPISSDINGGCETKVSYVKEVRSGGFIPGRCWRCGNTGHYGRDLSCPARARKCTSCGEVGHFAAACRQVAGGSGRGERGGGRWQQQQSQGREHG